MTNSQLARALADKLDSCVIPAEHQAWVTLGLVLLNDVVDGAHFPDKIRLWVEGLG